MKLVPTCNNCSSNLEPENCHFCMAVEKDILLTLRVQVVVDLVLQEN